MTSPVVTIHSGILPWTKSCFVCGESNPHGLRLRSRVEGDRIILQYTPREADLGYRRIVHGGITMTLLDEVMTWAAILVARQMCVAAEMSSRLRAPVTVGVPLRIEGWVTQFRSRLILTAGTVLDSSGTALAQATGKYAPMPTDHVTRCSEDFVSSPESIPISDIMAPD